MNKKKILEFLSLNKCIYNQLRCNYKITEGLKRKREIEDFEPNKESKTSNNSNSSTTSIEVELSEKQIEILNFFLEGNSGYLTGAAGVGKSAVLKEVIKGLKIKFSNDEFNKVILCGSTAVSVAHMGGVTVNSFFGLGMGDTSIKEIITSLSDYKKYMILYTSVLIIDEISMLNDDLFDKINIILQIIKKCSDPFGGIQFIACGDFFQLKPVKGNYCFVSKNWPLLGRMKKELTYSFRQENDNDFFEFLNNLRLGNNSDKLYLQLKQCENRQLENNKGTISLFARRKYVDAQNKRELESLDGKKFEFKSYDYIEGTIKKIDSKGIDLLNKLTQVSENLEIKIGCQVMLLKNTKYFSNGSIGIVQDVNLENNTISVKLSNDKIVFVKGMLFEASDPDNGKELKRKQFPMTLCYATTIHKSQGSTCEAIQVDFTGCTNNSYGENDENRDYSGIFYVAASRTNRFSGFKYQNLKDPNIIVPNKTVLKYYNMGLI